ncbi:hypothetical protein EDD29_8626 [Actinocorallia herbida]|uniref:Uncharacterized protein n=1 Tax=Actinocorallia herbida TaxID=58109 RepID=A0A3N1DBI8_9ACTN|nr:hypothetical protein [Actinocorallia herbida]ROO90885.1 hypothetical protein EDD29_8626 [Actinocorallia herbida]
MKWLKALGITAFWWLLIGTAAALAADLAFGLDDSLARLLIFVAFFVLGLIQAIRYLRSNGARGRIIPARPTP